MEIVIDQVTFIPEQLDPSFVLDGPLLSVKQGSLKIACHQKDCQYVAKKMTLAGYTSPGCPTRTDLVRNEILISELAGRLGIGPQIYTKSLDREAGWIIMDRYDGDLSQLLDLYQDDRSIPIDTILMTVGKILQILHQNNIVHRDFHPGNIFYTRRGLVVAADYEFALRTDSKVLKEIDRTYYMIILKIVEKIKSGVRFPPGEAFTIVYHEIVTDALPEVDFLWNGKICPDPK